MTTSFTTVNLKDVLSFPFRDEKWVSKLLIASLLMFFSFLIFPGFIFMGYIYEIMRRVIVEREEPSLPEWDEWGDYLANGFQMWAVSALYMLPALVFAIPYLVVFTGLPWIADNSELAGFSVLLIFGSFALGAFGTLVMLAAQVLLVPAWGHMVAKGDFKAAFRLKEFLPVLRNNLVGYLLSVIIYIGLMYIVMFVSQLLVITIILCVLYPFVLIISSIYLSVVMSALLAQAYVDGVENTAAKEAALLAAATE